MKASLEINGKIFVSVKRAAEIFGYSRDHLTRLAKAKKIAGTQLGRFWYVSEQSLKNYFDDQLVEAKVRQSILSKDRQAELQLHSALDTARDTNQKLSQNSGQLAVVCTLLFFGLLLAAASQVVPSASVSVASLIQSTQDVPLTEVAVPATQPVFTYDNTVSVGNSDRSVQKPEVTSQWVQITP